MPASSVSSATSNVTLKTSAAKRWFVYLVRAANGALYCGISDDPQRRFTAHQSGKGARFFYSSPAVALVYVEACCDKREALRQERLIKQLKKSAKETLVSSFGVGLEGAIYPPS
ncbi:GIY-YIG nuclease family protein [Pseudomonas sp. 10B1]|uniref:GIY-YIG nuclease family protein n=1 Tax=unclassified Pseudomonas TaxID=196821 RepID=UPI002AB51577|nr:MULTISPECIES: GIY-YIG nuclease family protein [unclassified Pseudomonas]MDY7559120.1 GIY-YIG nuclease family protein [Pseudomonas sp. AB6]MEA9977686.1 GIY-YIG nuclease family protein [Pseudomonas sp. RTS4]MEA9996681.1 GIY-YIG nuclease family protein [Pseudomonas sp. AA4]MEB0087745.1 GIY-YIG nuclease family protein [Pseudomonas sp. RTI1]MEB0124867.1 GIY-YIG nuclease family protein [Pseudomonas sp. CCC1.2]